MRELRGAEQAYSNRNMRGGLLGAKRAAGMALRGVLTAEPNPSYGRNYVQHLAGLAVDASAPDAVRASASRLHAAVPSTVSLVMLRAPASNEHLLEAARDVMAHAYARIVHLESVQAKSS